MNKIFIILLIFIMNCEVYDDYNEHITKINVKISFNNQVLNSKYTHIYFKNLTNSQVSDAYTFVSNPIAINKMLYPGYYDIYFYGLQEKKGRAQQVSFYSILKNVALNSETKDVNATLNELSPNYETIFKTDLLNIAINMKGINEIFGISSLSIKIGSNRTKSIDFQYDSSQNKYIGKIPLNANYTGKCFLNISYNVKSPLGDDSLDEKNIYISTTYFKSIFIGNI